MNGVRRSTRHLNVENDENRSDLRFQRAKLAQYESENITQVEVLKNLQNSRPRAALGDVSNVNAVTRQDVPGHRINTRRATAAAAAAAEAAALQASEETLCESSENIAKRKRSLQKNKEEWQQKEILYDNFNSKKLRLAAPETRNIVEQEWDDLDAEDSGDPLMVSEYVDDIFKYMRKLDEKTMPDTNYIALQPELSWKMRGILCDWLIEVHGKFRLLPETLFLAVNLIDRFLSKKTCSLGKLQLVGITCLFLASKYEEVLCPSIKNFAFTADYTYSEDEILKAENYILLSLDFNLAYPNPMNYLRRISKADDYNIQVRTIAKYLCEISLLDYRLIPFPPSHTSAAAMLLAREMLNRGEWNANLIHYSGGYTEHDLRNCYEILIDYLDQPPKHEAFFKKYASKKFMKVSLFVQNWIQKKASSIERFYVQKGN